MKQNPASSSSAVFRISEKAIGQLENIITHQRNESGAVAMRVVVIAGGCNGFQYSFSLDTEQQSDDTVISAGKAKVIIDPDSMNLLKGSELDFKDNLMGSHFVIHNPQAKSSCSCGSSFSTA